MDGSEEKETSELEDFVGDSGESDTQGFTQETQENAEDAATKDAKTDTDNTVLDSSLTLLGGEEGNILTSPSPFELSGDNLEQSLTGDVEELTGTVLELATARETLNTTPITDSRKYDKVTVNVLALSGTFPEGTYLEITPVVDEKLEEITQKILDENEKVQDGAKVEEGAKMVAFDIKFLYKLSNGSGIELQPKDGESVKVTFDFTSDTELKQADKSDEQEIQIYHINDKDENGEKVAEGEEVVEKIDINVEESQKIGEVVVDAENFSTYVVTYGNENPELSATLVGDDDTKNDFHYKTITISDGTNTYILMDRNLGARVAWNTGTYAFGTDYSSNYDTASDFYGYYYQWGNNYGFSAKTTAGQAGPVTVNSSDMPSKYSSSTWINTNPWNSENNLWGNVTNTEEARQGPCPTGWHVPSSTEWSNIYTAWSNSSNKSTSESSASMNFAKDLQLPTAGNRSYSILNFYYRGSYGLYWSSTPLLSNIAYYLHFDSSVINPQNYGDRSYGLSVRCLKNSPSTFTLTFNATENGGTTSVSPNPKTETAGTVINLSTSTYPAQKAGYTFVGWNTDKNATTALSSITLNADTTVYAIFSKTLSANFVLKDSNAATLSSTTATCTYYNNNSACTLTAPTLKAKAGYTVDGWSTTNGGTTANATTFTDGSTYYSVTYNNTAVTVSFNVNGNGGSNSSASCYKYNGSSTCTVSCPDITPASGFTKIGWGTASDSHTANACAVNETSPAVSSNTTYWAQSSKAGYSVTLTYQKSTGVSSISPASQTCDVATVYNGATQVGCTKSAPTITCSNGYSNGVFSPSPSTAVLANTTYTATCSDTTAPVCSISTQPTRTSMSLVNGYNQGIVTFTCTDNVGVSTTNLSASNITYDSNVVTLSNFTAGGESTSKTFTFTYTANAQGSTTFALKAGAVSDAAGNSNVVTDASNTVTVDTTAPTITITQENAGTWTKSKSVTASASDGTLTMKESTSSTCNSSVQDFVTYADKNYISESDNGKYICYKAVDSVGNTSYLSSTKIEKIDTTAPTLDSKTPFLSTWYTTDQTSTFTYTDTGAGINEGYNTASCIISTEGIDSTCQVTPNICDKVGNCNTTTQTSNSIKLDKTKPTCTITGNPTSPTNQNVELTLNYLVEANQISDGYSWDGESYSTTKKFTVTENGTYTGYVKDAAGNTGSCNVEVTMIDKVLPDITINNPDTTPAQSKTITATTDKGTLYMAITGVNVCDDSLDFVAYDEITFDLESDNGKYVCYKAVDNAGNVVYEISAQIEGIKEPSKGGNYSGGGGRRTLAKSDTYGSAETGDKIDNVVDVDTGDIVGENKSEEENSQDKDESQTLFTQEQIDAYTWANENGITTKSTIESAEINTDITREQLAKMMVVYMSKVLGKQPVINKTAKYRDVSEKSRGKEMYDYIQLAYQYQIMGINYKGEPIRYFNPSGKVTRAEYATVLSRVLYGSKYNQKGTKYYEKHMKALNEAGILTNNNPDLIELRGWIMLMLHRSLKKL